MTRPTREFKAFLQRFEMDLDARYAASHVHGMDADQALGLLMFMSEHMATRQPMNNSIKKAIETYAPYLVSATSGAVPTPEGLIEDMEFGAHYYMLREYLYYAFNFEGAFQWTMDDAQVDVRFHDPSIPRQFVVSHNESITGALKHFRDDTLRRELRELIQGVDEWDACSERIDELLKAEADHKLSAYFSIIPSDSPIDLGGYSYGQFYALYRMLVAKALWHRYQAEVNGAGGALYLVEDDLVEAAVADTGIPHETLRRILRDLVYDTDAVADRLSPGYFSLMREGGQGRIWMRPTHFSIHEGVVGMLRVVAQRRQRQFLTHVSEILGAGFVDRMAAAFSAQGFQCLREVKLTQYDQALPDIDLLVISHEPTLGYVILVCELKCPIPSTWARDHIKALNNDSISKAFVQSKRVGEFFTRPSGLEVLRSWLPAAGLPHFDHFVVVLEPLIITSHNAGMFFDAMNTPVFPYHTIERMLEACDGDMAYIQNVLRTYSAFVDQHVPVERRTVSLVQREVGYEVVGAPPIMHFPPNKWRSDQSRERVIQEFLDSGLRPIDTFLPSKDIEDNEQPDDESAELVTSRPAGHRVVVLFDDNLERRGQYLEQLETENAADATGG